MAAAKSIRACARVSPVGGTVGELAVVGAVGPSVTADSEAHTMSSNSGRSGSTTKSSAPVISTVRWPSRRCSRTRRMAAGKDLARMQLAEHLGRVLVDLVDGGVVVAAVEEAQEVAAVLAVERQQRRAPRPVCGPRSAAARRGAGRRVASHE